MASSQFVGGKRPLPDFSADHSGERHAPVGDPSEEDSISQFVGSDSSVNAEADLNRLLDRAVDDFNKEAIAIHYWRITLTQAQEAIRSGNYEAQWIRHRFFVHSTTQEPPPEHWPNFKQ